MGLIRPHLSGSIGGVRHAGLIEIAVFRVEIYSRGSIRTFYYSVDLSKSLSGLLKKAYSSVGFIFSITFLDFFNKVFHLSSLKLVKNVYSIFKMFCFFLFCRFTEDRVETFL